MPFFIQANACLHPCLFCIQADAFLFTGLCLFCIQGNFAYCNAREREVLGKGGKAGSTFHHKQLEVPGKAVVAFYACDPPFDPLLSSLLSPCSPRWFPLYSLSLVLGMGWRDLQPTWWLPATRPSAYVTITCASSPWPRCSSLSVLAVSSLQNLRLFFASHWFAAWHRFAPSRVCEAKFCLPSLGYLSSLRSGRTWEW